MTEKPEVATAAQNTAIEFICGLKIASEIIKTLQARPAENALLP